MTDGDVGGNGASGSAGCAVKKKGLDCVGL